MAQDSNTSPQFSEDEFLARNFDNEYPSYLKLPEGFDYNLFYVDKNTKRLRKMTNRHEVTEHDPNIRYIGEDGQEIEYHPGFWWDVADASPDEEHAYEETRNWRIENKGYQQAIQDRRIDEALEIARANGAAPSEDLVVKGVGPAKPTQEPQVETIYSNGVASEAPSIQDAQNRFQLRDINRYWATKELNDKYGGAAWGKQVGIPLAIGAGAALGASYALPWLATGASNYVLPWLSTNLAPGSLGGNIIGNVAGFSLANKGINDLIYKPLTGSNNTYMEDIFQGIGGENIQNPYLREAARFGVDLFDPLNLVPYGEVGEKVGRGLNYLESNFKPHLNFKDGLWWSFGDNPQNEYRFVSQGAYSGIPIPRTQIRPFQGNVKEEADRIVGNLAETRPALHRAASSTDPNTRDAARQTISQLEQIANGNYITPSSLVISPEEANSGKFIFPTIGNLEGNTPLLNPEIDLALAFRNKFPLFDVTLKDGTKKVNVGQMVHGFRGVDLHGSTSYTGLLDPTYTNRNYFGQTFAASADTPWGALYYDNLGRKPSGNLIRNYWSGNRLKNGQFIDTSSPSYISDPSVRRQAEELRLQLNDQALKWADAAENAGITRTGMTERTPMLITDPKEVTDYLSLYRRLNHLTGLERGPGSIIEIGGNKRGSLAEFDWGGGSYSNRATGRFKNPIILDNVKITGGKPKYVKDVNDLNKALNSSDSEYKIGTDLMVIKDIQDGSVYTGFDQGEFNRRMNDIIYGPKNWTISKYKHGGNVKITEKNNS